jgi:hypothetical protein
VRADQVIQNTTDKRNSTQTSPSDTSSTSGRSLLMQGLKAIRRKTSQWSISSSAISGQDTLQLANSQGFLGARCTNGKCDDCEECWKAWKQGRKEEKTKYSGAGFVSGLRQKLSRYGKKSLSKDVIEGAGAEQTDLLLQSTERQRYLNRSEDFLGQGHRPDLTLITPSQKRLSDLDSISRKSRYRPQRTPIYVSHQEYSPPGTTGSHTSGSYRTSSTPRTKSTHSLSSDGQLPQIMETSEEELNTPSFYSQSNLCHNIAPLHIY